MSWVIVHDPLLPGDDLAVLPQQSGLRTLGGPAGQPQRRPEQDEQEEAEGGQGPHDVVVEGGRAADTDGGVLPLAEVRGQAGGSCCG